MFKLFELLFHDETMSDQRYPEELVKKAIERSVDATDPRVRIIGPYAKQLHPAVVHAIDYLIQLVDCLSTPIPFSPEAQASEVLLNTMFSSAGSLLGCLQRDLATREFLASTPSQNSPVFALLMAKPSRRHIFGHDLVNDKMVSDVPLTVVSFDDHRLVGLTHNETETRRVLKWRAFDYVLVSALNLITEAQAQRTDLKSRLQLLQTKLDILQRSSGHLLHQPQIVERQKLQQRMEQVEAQFKELGAEDTVLQQHLDLICQTLMAPEQQLSCHHEILYIDPMQYLREPTHPKARAVPIQMLHNGKGHQMAIQLVTIPSDCIAVLRQSRT